MSAKPTASRSRKPDEIIHGEIPPRDVLLKFIADNPDRASKREIAEFRKVLETNPSNYIAQPTLALSACPTHVASGVAPRHVDLRPYVLIGDQVRITPGGLTRVALKKGSLVVNSSQGGGTKDTWVLED